MKLLVKFNLLLIVVFGLGLCLIAYQARSFLQEQAQAEVLREAGLMAASALATRNYTEHYITPVIEKTTEHTTTFLPQAIPFFASTTTFEQIRQTYPDYTYKEAALNPTNLRDRATDWEADMINYFRNSPKETELVRMRDSATGPSSRVGSSDSGRRADASSVIASQRQRPRRSSSITDHRMDSAGTWTR